MAKIRAANLACTKPHCGSVYSSSTHFKYCAKCGGTLKPLKKQKGKIKA